MKNFKNNNKMKNKLVIVLCILLGISLFSSCKVPETQYDGLILTDENTGKKYLLKHNYADTYFIDEAVMIISGKDTTYAFR
jgi:hypothetical protein